MISPFKIKISTPGVITVLFIIGMVIAHATGIRFNNIPIGLSEIVLFTTVILIAFNSIFLKRTPVPPATSLFLVFWLLTLLLLTLGYINSIILGLESTHTLHNSLAILFIVFISVGMSLHFVSAIKMERAMVFVFALFLIIQLFVFVVAKTKHSLFGVELFNSNEYYRFKGLSENPNQLALFFCIMPFVFARTLFCENKKYKIISFFAILVTLYLGYQTRSDALLLAWFVGITAFVIITMTTKLFRSLTWQLCFIGTTVGAIIIIIINVLPGLSGSDGLFLNATKSAETIYYSEGNQGSVRVRLWNNGLEALRVSPLFGFGPGSFSGLETPFENKESHNTIIDWGLQTGLAGALLLSILVLRPFVNLWKTMRVDLMAGIVAIVVFAEFHYVLRHPLVWLIILWIWLAGSRPEDSQEIVAENKDGLEPQ